jgi:hypothetical protein
MLQERGSASRAPSDHAHTAAAVGSHGKRELAPTGEGGGRGASISKEVAGWWKPQIYAAGSTSTPSPTASLLQLEGREKESVRHGYRWVPTDQAHGRPRQVGPTYQKTRRPVSGPNRPRWRPT